MRARELYKDAFRGLTDVSKLSLKRTFQSSVLIALELEEPPQQLMPELLIGYSSVMVVGRAKTPRMAMLKTILILVC